VTVGLAQVLATMFEAYGTMGLLFAVLFLPRAALRVDPRLRASPVAVRLLILPGVAALWPLFAWRWISHAGTPDERTPHRTAAGRARARRIETDASKDHA
jgi:hypothetical protein